MKHALTAQVDSGLYAVIAGEADRAGTSVSHEAAERLALTFQPWRMVWAAIKLWLP